MANDETTYAIVEGHPNSGGNGAAKVAMGQALERYAIPCGRWVRMAWLMFDGEHKQNAKNNCLRGALNLASKQCGTCIHHIDKVVPGKTTVASLRQRSVHRVWQQGQS